MSYTEFSTVEEPIIGWLVELGWSYVPADKLNREPLVSFIIDDLETSLIHLN
jgi:hypothetical protein